jgi:hypothetical protein
MIRRAHKPGRHGVPEGEAVRDMIGALGRIGR